MVNHVVNNLSFVVYIIHYSLHSLSSSCLSGWDSEIDIQKSIQLVRSQRSGMVQTEVSIVVLVVYGLSRNFSLHIATVQVCL